MRELRAAQGTAPRADAHLPSHIGLVGDWQAASGLPTGYPTVATVPGWPNAHPSAYAPSAGRFRLMVGVFLTIDETLAGPRLRPSKKSCPTPLWCSATLRLRKLLPRLCTLLPRLCTLPPRLRQPLPRPCKLLPRLTKSLRPRRQPPLLPVPPRQTALSRWPWRPSWCGPWPAWATPGPPSCSAKPFRWPWARAMAPPDSLI